MWICPNCKRRFKNANQDHSCVIKDVNDHFYNKEPYVRDLYERLMDIVNKFDDIEVRYVKHGIMVSGSSTFLAIKPKKHWIDIELLLKDIIDDKMISKTFKVSKNRTAHFIRISDSSDINTKLKKLIKESYLLTKS